MSTTPIASTRSTPVGTAQIIALSTGLSNNVSVASVRSIGFDFDPVNP